MKKKSITIDIVAGLLVAILSYTILNFFPFELTLIIVSPLPVIAGFIRGRDHHENFLIKTALMNILFYPLVMAIMKGVFHLLLLLAIGITGTALGIALRHYFFMFKAKMLILLFCYFTSIIASSNYFLPWYFDHLQWTTKEETAPEYLFISPEGHAIHSKDQNGKVVILNFWATWCGPCKRLLPVMENIYNDYKDNEDVVFLFVNPCGRDTYATALEFIKKSPYHLPFAMDIKEVSTKKFNVSALPTLIFIDKKGYIRLIHYGYEDSESFRKKVRLQVDRLLKETK